MAYDRLDVSGRDFTVTKWNDNITKMELLGTDLIGRCVISGLELSAGAGLSLDISNGKLNARSVVSLTSVVAFNCPSNTTRYIWIDESGVVTGTTTLTYPGGNVVCLGRVTTSGVAITEISDEGRQQIPATLVQFFSSAGAIAIPTGNYVMTRNDRLIASNRSAPATITLPAISDSSLEPFDGQEFMVHDYSGNAQTHAITLNVPSGVSLNGVVDGTVTINSVGGWLHVYYDGGGYRTTGTMQVSRGGTGHSSYAVGDVLYASGTETLSKLAAAATGNSLLSGATPSWGKVGLTTHVSGTLPAANGGTGQSAYTIGDLLYASGASALSKLADVATGNALISGGVGAAPAWGKINVTTHITGVTPIANGGTNASSFGTSTGIVYYDGSSLVTDSNFVYNATSDRGFSGNGWFIQGGANNLVKGFFIETGFGNADAVLEFAINSNQGGGRDTSKAGALFRFDLRNSIAATNVPYFSVIRQPVGSSEVMDLQIGTAGEVGIGKAESASHNAKLDVTGTNTGKAVLRLTGMTGHLANLLEIFTGAGVDLFKVHNSAGFIVNDTGLDYDIRFEGDTDANLFFLDASTDRIGIGNAAPNNKLDVTGTVQADGLRLDVTPTAETPSATHTFTISLNGVNYKVLCLAA